MHATIPKGNMGYDQFTVPDTVAVQPTLICYLPLALANIRPWPLAFSQISLKNSELKTTTIPFGIVACTFPTTFLEIAVVELVLLYTKTTWTVLLVLKIENFTHSLTP